MNFVIVNTTYLQFIYQTQNTDKRIIFLSILTKIVDNLTCLLMYGVFSESLFNPNLILDNNNKCEILTISSSLLGVVLYH